MELPSAANSSLLCHEQNRNVRLTSEDKGNSSYKKAFHDVREEEIHAEAFGITQIGFLGV